MHFLKKNLDCKHAHFCLKTELFNIGVCGDCVTFGASLGQH